MIEPALLTGSKWTPRKQEAFARMIRVYAPIAAAIQRKHRCGPWLYADLTAGSGRIVYGDATILGSPALAMEAFRVARLDVDCVLIEMHPGRAAALEQTVDELRAGWDDSERERIRCRVYALDHRPHLSSGIARQRYGLLYWDGHGKDRYPAEEIQAWLDRHPLHDVLGMASGCAPKRMGATRLTALLEVAINGNGRRRCGYISEPESTTGWEWVFALITGWPPLAERLSGSGVPLFDFRGTEGQRILDRVATTGHERALRERAGWPQLWEEQPPSEYRTYREYLAHPRFLAVRAEAMRLAGGRCCRCGAPATEVHHLRYPPWGEFDVVENLEPICHPCHADEHGKVS